MARNDGVRAHVGDLLAWEAAHVTFDRAMKGVPLRHRGMRPPGFEHSLWELLEHLRRAQQDILAFCRDPDYTEPHWPDDYWPDSPVPPTRTAWDQSIRAVKRDRAALKALVADAAIDLLAPVPQGDGQTFLREFLLVADHAAYHVGQIVQLRRALGLWPPG